MNVVERLRFRESLSDSSAETSLDGAFGPLELEAFDPQTFRQVAEIAVARLERYLANSSVRGLALTDPTELQQAARGLMVATGAEGGPELDEARLGKVLDLYIQTGIQVHSPGYMGRQFSGPAPLAGVVDFVGSIVNQPSSFYEAAQLPRVVERIMAEELNRFIGWDPDRFAMITTSGGSLANLTAILAARNNRFPQSWSKGIATADGNLRPAVAIGEDAHYSVRRAVGILGLGEDQIVVLPSDEKRRIRGDAVRPALRAAEERGLDVFCLVASAGTTSIGAFDPIDELAEIARDANIWLHVDGAHGASLLVSDTLRHKLNGIEKADSFAWDAHKMMFVPAQCTLLFYRDKEKSKGAFVQDASYVFEKEPDIYTEFDSAEQNLECTKRPMIMGLWVLWALYGKAPFVTKIEYLCELARKAHAILEHEPDFAPLHHPEANILCFRYLPANLPARLEAGFQTMIRDQVRKEGKFFISKVDIDGKPALRVVVMNHRISVDHFRMLLHEIERVGQALILGAQAG